MTRNIGDPGIISPENEKAIRGFLAASGGIEGYLANGGKLVDMVPLVDATEDELRESGILEFAEIVESRRRSAGYTPDPQPSDEPLLTPEAATAWLLGSKQAKEIDGELRLEDKPSHFAMAGLLIASGAEPRFLSEAYAEATDHSKPLSDNVLQEMARTVVDSYTPEE